MIPQAIVKHKVSCIAIKCKNSCIHIGNESGAWPLQSLNAFSTGSGINFLESSQQDFQLFLFIINQQINCIPAYISIVDSTCNIAIGIQNDIAIPVRD